MSLRHRLYLVVGALVLVPVLVAALLATVLLPGQVRSQRYAALEAGNAAVSAALRDACAQVGLVTRNVALEAVTAGPTTAASEPVAAGLAGYAALLDADGRVVAEAGSLPPGMPPPGELGSCSGSGGGAMLAERVEVTGVSSPGPGAGADDAAAIRTALAAQPPDAALAAARRAAGPSTQVLLLDGSQPVAATVEAAAAAGLAAELPEQGRASLRGQLASVTRLEGTSWRVVTATSAPDTGLLGLAALAALLVAAGLVAVFARRLAGHLTQPLRELTAAAERVAGGDLATTIAVREPEEVARLAGSFNRMTTELKRNMDALQRSRDEMRESLQRLGETLESTHDLEGLLTLVLEAAADLVGARAGVAYTLESAGTLTRVAQIDRTGSGPGAPRHLPVGTGVLGSVAATARAARGRLGQHLTPADGEPASGEALALPLCRGSQVVGVLALYGRVDGSAYGPAEEEEIATLARQAGIAVDNVLLHREAQRLSITDPLTGIGNFRYLSMSLGRELERAARYGREVAVLMLDLDHFKAVNDTHGHARGDQVLRELAARVSEQIRDIDILARYGGEEFVLVLPETSAQGAATLAERVCAAVRREPFRGEPGAPALRVTASVGVATFPQHGESPATLLRAADAALYEAKAEGRDRMRLAPV